MFDLMAAFRSMARMRYFDEAVAAGVASGEIHGEMHVGLGQEAIAAGVEPHLRPGDAVVSTHRPHFHALINGVDPVAMLAELFERDGGLCRGRGGHMHLFDPAHRFMCTGIVGASAPQALGYAFAIQYRDEPALAVAVMGEGATNIGAFSESLNLAALWRLPVLFLVEDNGYGISVPRALSTAGAIERRGEAYGVPGWSCDGTDVEEVFETAGRAVTHVRDGLGPALVVATAYRYSGHYEGDLDLYRPAGEKDAARRPERDPIARARERLGASGRSEDELRAAEDEERRHVEAWVAEARAKPWPEPVDVLEGVFA